MQHYFNWFFQSLLIICGAVAFIGTLAGYNLITLLLFTQLILSLWQYIGCLLTIRHHLWLDHLRKMYLQLSSAGLLVFFLTMIFSTSVVWNTLAHLVIFFIVPWCFAVFYYVITWRTTFRNRKRGNFLPHLSF